MDSVPFSVYQSWAEIGQAHLFHYWETLNLSEKNQLIESLKSLSPTQIHELSQSILNSKTEKQIHNAIAAFIKSYRRMSNSKTMSEASDTAVRECVFSFLEKVARCTGIDSELLETIWYENS
jgi:predicted Zn-ribbon and HTH transcriptional regulator